MANLGSLAKIDARLGSSLKRYGGAYAILRRDTEDTLPCFSWRHEGIGIFVILEIIVRVEFLQRWYARHFGHGWATYKSNVDVF